MASDPCFLCREELTIVEAVEFDAAGEEDRLMDFVEFGGSVDYEDMHPIVRVHEECAVGYDADRAEQAYFARAGI